MEEGVKRDWFKTLFLGCAKGDDEPEKGGIRGAKKRGSQRGKKDGEGGTKK